MTLRPSLMRPRGRLAVGFFVLAMLVVLWSHEQARQARERWIAGLQSPGLYLREITWSSLGKQASVSHRLAMLLSGGEIHVASRNSTQTQRLLDAVPDRSRYFRITLHYDPPPEELSAIGALIPKSSLSVVLPGANTGRRVW